MARQQWVFEAEIYGRTLQLKRCSRCNKLKVMETDFHLDQSQHTKKMTICKKCDHAKKQRWRLQNPAKEAKIRQRRMMIQASLKNDLTKEQREQILDDFNYACSLTGNAEDVQLDHFIPVHTGHGGKTLGNMVPLTASLNYSKNGKNPFEWIKTRSSEEQERFKHVVAYLAEQNNKSTDEYKKYVYDCFRKQPSIFQTVEKNPSAEGNVR